MLKVEPSNSLLVTIVPGEGAGEPFEPWCDVVLNGNRARLERQRDGSFGIYGASTGTCVVEIGRGDGAP